MRYGAAGTATACVAAIVVGACASTSNPQPTTSAPQPSRAPGAAADKVVQAPAVQRLAVQALNDIALGRGEYHKHLHVPFMIGPGLWGEMLKLEPALAKIGTESISVVPMSGGTRGWKMGGFMDNDAVAKIAHHTKLRAVAEAFRDGQVRPANPEERQLFYALTPLEIAGKPLTVFSIPPDHRLVVYVEDGKLVWIDLLSAYSALLR
jgi:hypothetical protein